MGKVSVIIPVYNRRGLIGRCLDSVFRQTWRPVELIIVDNGSDDGTFEFVSEWSSSHISPDFSIRVLVEPKGGACRARNRGLYAATGEFCMFFDSDDEMRPCLIEKGVMGFHRNPDAVAVCWRCEIHQLDGTVRIPPFSTVRPMENHLVHTLLRTQGYMVRRSVFRKTGCWDPGLQCWNDLELGVRIILNVVEDQEYGDRKAYIAGIPEVLADIYSQKDSITGTAFSLKTGEWEKSLEKIEEDIQMANLTSRTKKYFMDMVAYKRMILAASYQKEGRPELASGLLDKVVGNGELSFFQKTILKILFRYTVSGGRGAWHAARLFFTAPY